MKFCVGTNCHYSTCGKLSVAPDWPLWISAKVEIGLKHSKIIKWSHCNAISQNNFWNECFEWKIKTKTIDSVNSESVETRNCFKIFSRITLGITYWEAYDTYGLCHLKVDEKSLLVSCLSPLSKVEGNWASLKAADSWMLCLNGFDQFLWWTFL